MRHLPYGDQRKLDVALSMAGTRMHSSGPAELWSNDAIKTRLLGVPVPRAVVDSRA